MGAPLLKFKEDLNSDIRLLKKLDREHSDWHTQAVNIQAALRGLSMKKINDISEFRSVEDL